jgi:hypothetical protein
MANCENGQWTPQMLWETHVATGEPLSESELKSVIEAGISAANEWDMRGDGLYWHALTWPWTDER